jgi:hypothetical protein
MICNEYSYPRPGADKPANIGGFFGVRLLAQLHTELSTWGKLGLVESLKK